MISALVALALAAAPACPCRTVRSRMDLWNGAPTVRIWMVGTHRVLGVVHLSGSLDDLSIAVRRIWTWKDANADWKTSIMDDFDVCS